MNPRVGLYPETSSGYSTLRLRRYISREGPLVMRKRGLKGLLKKGFEIVQGQNLKPRLGLDIEGSLNLGILTWMMPSLRTG